MKCPKCLKEISDEASFCGYCGQVINKEQIQNVCTEEVVNLETQSEQKTTQISYNKSENENNDNVPNNKSGDNVLENKSNIKKPKKHIGLKILLIFSIIAIVAGAVLGLLTAKGIVDLSNIIPSNRFEWTDFSEALDTDSESTASEEISDDKDTILSDNTLVVGISPDYEPFEYYKNDELVGFDIDLIKLIADELGYEIEFKTHDFANLVSALSNGEVDLVISAMTIIDEREEVIDFTDVYVSETYVYEGENVEASYAIALPKNSTLKTSLNEQINRLKENGTIQNLVQKYYID